MNWKRLTALACMCILCVTGVSFAETISFTDSQYITWTQIKQKIIENIVYDDEDYLYVKMSGEIVKLHKRFQGDFMPLTQEEKNYISSFVQVQEQINSESNLIEIKKEDLLRKDQHLYYGDIKLLSLEEYIKENDEFYEERPNDQKGDIGCYGSYYTLRNGEKLIFIKTFTSAAVPPPYTPWHADMVRVSKDGVQQIQINDRFEPVKIIEDQDGTLWIQGYISPWKSTSEVTLYRIDLQGKMTSINQQLKVNYIEIIGKGKNQLMFFAETQNSLPYYMPPNYGVYEKNKKGVYTINTKGRLEEAYSLEKMKDGKKFYSDQQGKIYCITDQGDSILNITDNQQKKISKGVLQEYQSALQKWNQYWNKENSQAVERVDKDGSIWFLKEGEIVHNLNGEKQKFKNGLEMMMYAVDNIFVDKDGGKWFIAAAGISYLDPGSQKAENMNPYLTMGDHAIFPGAAERIYIDQNKKVWYFHQDKIIQAEFKQKPILAEEASYIKGYEQIPHHYTELAGAGIFIYQNQEKDQVYNIRVVTITKEGNIQKKDYVTDKPIKTYFVKNNILYMILSNGVIKIENDKRYDLSNEGMLTQESSYAYIDPHNMLFKNDYQIIKMRIPSFGQKVDTYKKSFKIVRVNGIFIPSYEVQGKTAICIEDLEYYGYKMSWDPQKRMTHFVYAPSEAKGTQGVDTYTIKESGDIYYSDIEIYFKGHKIPNYNTGGYSLVAIDKLKNFKEINIVETKGDHSF
ncbi:hypothetical protein QBE52_00170 [Clostridiaceae bacterium 35-E11]